MPILRRAGKAAKGPCGFGSSQWKRARANKPAICKACALDAENAAPQAVDKAAVLAAFLLRESEGAVDGKKRTVRGVARRAAKLWFTCNWAL